MSLSHELQTSLLLQEACYQSRKARSRSLAHAARREAEDKMYKALDALDQSAKFEVEVAKCRP